MKNLKFSGLFYIYTLFIMVFVFQGCDDKDSDGNDMTLGTVDVRFENIVGNGVNLSLTSVGNTSYPFTNGMDQTFNVTVLKYIISEIVLEGPNGERYEDELSVSADEVKGYYLVNQAKPGSMVITLNNVPAGTYNKIFFKVGVDQSAVEEGAAGGILSQGGGATGEDMFWSWNVGYQTLRIEGQTPANETGIAIGESLTETDTHGFACHIGGWAVPNNNKDLSLDTDEIEVNRAEAPEIHLVMDVLELLTNPTVVDFSLMFNVHSPSAGETIANNIPNAFKFDHIHQ